MLIDEDEALHYRNDTPGCAAVVHFNHAGASLMPQPVVDSVIDHLKLEAKIGGYEAEDFAAAEIEGVYASAASLIGAHPKEIALIENATRAWDMAFYSFTFEPGDRILTSRAEYASNVIAFLQAAEKGVSIEVVPNDDTGQMSVSALAGMIDNRCKLIAVSHMPTNGGLIQPAAEIGAIARKAGIPFLLDACQTVGQFPVDVGAIQCDMLSATSRKYLRGPRGAGFLYVRDSLIQKLKPPMLDLHAAEWTSVDGYQIDPTARRFENWEKSYATLLGMGTAISYAQNVGLDRIWSRIETLSNELRCGLSAIPGVQVHDLGARRGGIVTFSVSTLGASAVVTRLHQCKINTVTSTVVSSRYDMEARGLSEIVRSSVHYITSAEELTLLLEAVEKLAGEQPL